MKCIKCNAELSENSVFCSVCGEKQEIYDAKEESEDKGCCDNEAVTAEEKTATETGSQEEREAPKKKKSKKKIILTIVLSVLSMLIIAGGVFGVLLINRIILTNKVSARLEGQAFQRLITHDLIEYGGSYSISLARLTFFNGNRVTIEDQFAVLKDDGDHSTPSKSAATWKYTASKVDENTVKLSVKKNSGYYIEFLPNGTVKNIIPYDFTSKYDDQAYTALDPETKRNFDDEMNEQINIGKDKIIENKKLKAVDILLKNNVPGYSNYTFSYLIEKMFLDDYEVNMSLSENICTLVIRGDYRYYYSSYKYVTEKDGILRVDIDIESGSVTLHDSSKDIMDAFYYHVFFLTYN